MHSSRMRTARALTIGRGVYLPRGDVPAGGIPATGVYLPRRGVPAQGGVPAQSCVPAQVLPPCEQNDRYVQKYYLAPNFFCGR